MRTDAVAAAAMGDGLDRIRQRCDVREQFPPAVLAAADEAARRRPEGTHRDVSDEPFVTLDPASSTDLDQAFWIESSGGDADIRLHYAIADVGFWVRPGDALDVEAYERAVTVYLPDRPARLYPPTLSEAAASLLPGDPRPAVVFSVLIGSDGTSRLDAVERKLVRNHAKLAYDGVDASDLPDGFDELFRRVTAAEVARGASRVEFPEQEIERRPDGGYGLRFRPRLVSEEQNAALSLSTNLAVAAALIEHATGLFRVMPEVDERRIRRLRHCARAFGLDWSPAVPLADFSRSLPRSDPRSSAFLMAVRRAGGGASYAPYDAARPPWHAAIAAPYAQATAPLRRLQDRYVIEATWAIANGHRLPDEVDAAFQRLPAAMAAGEQRANRAEREALDLAEAVALAGRVGDTFEAVVIDEGDWGVEVQIADPAIVARLAARRVDPGDTVQVRLLHADPVTGSVGFERVG